MIRANENFSEAADLPASKTKRSWVDDITGIIDIDGDIDEKKFKSDRLAEKYGLDELVPLPDDFEI